MHEEGPAGNQIVQLYPAADLHFLYFVKRNETARRGFDKGPLPGVKPRAVPRQELAHDTVVPPRRYPIVDDPVQGGERVLPPVVPGAAMELIEGPLHVPPGNRGREEFPDPPPQRDKLAFVGGLPVGLQMTLLVLLAATAPTWVVAARERRTHGRGGRKGFLVVFFLLVPDGVAGADIVYSPRRRLWQGKLRQTAASQFGHQVLTLAPNAFRHQVTVPAEQRTAQLDPTLSQYDGTGGEQERKQPG